MMMTPPSVEPPASDIEPDNDFKVLGLSEPQQQGLVKQLHHELLQRQERRERQEKLWKACWAAYRCEPPGPTEADLNGIARPIVFQAVENLHATMMSQLFPKSGQFFHVMGQSREDHDHAETVEHFLRYKLNTQGFQGAFSLFLKEMLITGTAVMMMPWYCTHATRTRLVPVKRLGITVGVEPYEEEVLKEQGPRFEVLNPLDVYIDDTLRQWQEGSLMRKLYKKARHVLGEARYHNKEVLKQQLHRWRELPDIRDAQKGIGFEETPITLVEVWGDLWLDGVQYKQHVAVYTLETHTLLRFEPHGLELNQPPFVVASLNPMPHQGYGIGVVEKSLGLQQAINTLTNQKLDILNLCINTPFTYLLNDEVFDPKTLNYRAGALIPVKNHETLRPLPLVAQNMSLAFQEIDDLKVEVLETTGSLRLMTGALEGNGQAPRTATEVDALTQNAHRKYDGVLMQLEQGCLEPMLTMVYQLCKQFWVYAEESRDATASPTNVEFHTWDADLLKHSCCDVKVTGSRGALKEEQELEGLLFLLRLSGELPDLLPRLDKEKIASRIIQRLGFQEQELMMPKPGSQTL
jgi:hypothetical protein